MMCLKFSLQKYAKYLDYRQKLFHLSRLECSATKKKRSRLKLFRIFAYPIMVPFFYKQDACSPERDKKNMPMSLFSHFVALIKENKKHTAYQSKPHHHENPFILEQMLRASLPCCAWQWPPCGAGRR
jgi:hypothetical protein